MSSDSEAVFYGTKGNRSSPKYLLVGESWGKDEAQQRKPFVGWSGGHLHTLLTESGIDENECLFTNVVPEQPNNNDMWRFFYPTKVGREENKLFIRGLCPMDNIRQGLENLHKLIKLTQPEFIIAIGNYALWALTDDSFSIDDDNYRKVPVGIMRYRGSQLYSSHDMGNIKLMPIVHPASMQAVWGNRYLIKHDLSMRLKQSWKEPDYVFEVRPTLRQVTERLHELTTRARHAQLKGSTIWLASDHETTVTKFIACTGIAWSSREAMCIPFVCEENKEGYWTEYEEFQIVLKLRKLLTHPGVTLIGQSYLYDAQYSALWWQMVRAPDLDTRIMQHLLWPGMSQDLNFISSLYREHHKYWKDDLKELYTVEGQTTGWRYNCMDCVSTYECAVVTHKIITDKGMLEQLAEEIEHLDMLLEMMIRGVKVDRLRRKEVAKELGETIKAYGSRIEPLVPTDLYTRKAKPAKPWYRSPKQLAEIIYDVLGMKEIKHPKTKKRTTSDAALHTLKQREPILIPIIEPIQEYRSVKKFSEFTEAPLDSDMRMRCEYSPTTDTFRLRSRKNVFGNGANLQNLPKGHEEED